MNQNKLLPIISYLGIFLLVTGGSYFLFNQLLPTNTQKSKSTAKITPTVTSKPGVISFQGPKTEVCPINGELFTKEEKDIWSTRRPLMVMIENHSDSRPQSGLQNADIVYEAVAEGGITRFMGVFYCNAAKGAESKYDLGPVRSARTYFLDLASEYSDYPLYTHVGGSNCSAATSGGPCTTNKRAQAIEQIASYGWNNKGTWGDLSQFSLSYKVCRREPERTGETKDTEHTMYCSSKELWNVAASRGLTNQTEIKKTAWDKTYRPWSFKAEDKASSSPTAKTISFDFWGDKNYSVTWKYDPATNRYLRYHSGDVAHVDFNTKETIYAKNIVIQFVKEERSVDEHKHNLYGMIGTGKGVLIQNGEKTEITWSKANRNSRTIFKTASGSEVNFIPGQTWVEILPINTKVSYEG
ncbi:MAG TPA: DUF3048 domain-containing protein [Candidatus Woesebacteria bacterium]|nr:DUF3048 domain-containing protein [Candidatus Woesebacteria bacterium]